METGACPPTDVWEDLPHLSQQSPEKDALTAELREHLKVCPDCRDRCAIRVLRRKPSVYQRAHRYANMATALFGIIGVTFVLTICFRTPLPSGTAQVTEEAPSQPRPTSTVLKQIEPLVSSFVAGD